MPLHSGLGPRSSLFLISLGASQVGRGHFQHAGIDSELNGLTWQPGACDFTLAYFSNIALALNILNLTRLYLCVRVHCARDSTLACSIDAIARVMTHCPESC